MSPNDTDALDALRASGVDPTMPTMLRHYVYVPQESSAKMLVERFQQDGFSIESRASADGTNWLILLTHKSLVTSREIARLRAYFADLVEPIGGEYDGWEAEVK
jgi:hypothetical protein